MSEEGGKWVEIEWEAWRDERRCAFFLYSLPTTQGVYPILRLRSLLSRVGDVEVNPAPVCRGCTETIRRDITPITCSSCSQLNHKTFWSYLKQRVLKASFASFTQDLRLL